MTMVWLLLLGLAEAGSVLDPAAFPVLEQVRFTWPTSGWTARLGDPVPGQVDVWVAHDEASAKARFEELAGEAPRAVALGADAAVGDAAARVLFREGELVVRVDRPSGGALDLSERLLKAVEDGGSWPHPPTLRERGDRLVAEGNWASSGWGRPSRFDPKTLLPVPAPIVLDGDTALVMTPTVTRVHFTGWDRFGRANRVDWHRNPVR